MIDLSRDEFRLAGLLERLSGRWCFMDAHLARHGQASLVDVPATNEALMMRGCRLDTFCAVRPGDPQVLPVEALPPNRRPIHPEEIAVVLLCGGLGSRGGGEIHPLRLVTTSETPQPRTLLDLQLDWLARSPLAGAPSLLLGSLLNETPLQRYLDGLPSVGRPQLYMGGLAPRLTLYQSRSDPPNIHRDSSGNPSYNPTGHLDALRWLVVGGVLTHLPNIEVVLVTSYSNFGCVFTKIALGLANYAAERGRQELDALFVAEVTARPRDKWTGSMLVMSNGDKCDVRLVKYGYGRGQLRLPEEAQVLMSTNTLYFSVANLLRRLCQACPAVGLPAQPAALTDLLGDASVGRRRAEAGVVFDRAFPIEPLLTHKRLPDGAEVLQIERDLDQLSLLPGPPAFQPVEVAADRAVSIKLPADLEDHQKQAFLLRDC